MSALHLTLFAAFWIASLYVLNSMVAGGWKRIQIKPMLLYVSTLAMLGVYGEFICGTIYNFLFGRPLWQYTVLPVHHAYTSMYALVLWSGYGFYLYMMHDNLLKRNKNAAKYLPYIFCLEAIIIEALVNLSYKIFFGEYIFYYWPSDLWHLTSIQVLPIYLAGGFAISIALSRGKTNPTFHTFAAIIFAGVLVFLT